MVEQQNGSSYTQILYSPSGGKLALMNGQTVVKAFVPLPAGGTAVYVGSTLSYFRHPDWLGSSRFASTPARTMYSDLAYAPFGETYAEAGTADRSFTGQNQDTIQGSTTGLYDFLFREYAQYGRWISPDPAGMAAVNPSNPQTWNRYVYVLNSPLNAVDVLGLDCFILGPGPLYPVWTVPCGSVPGDDPLPPNPFDDGVLHLDAHLPGRINLAQCIDVHGPRGCAGAVVSGLQKGLNYLKSHPVFISVNEIVAAQITYQQSTGTICANLGAGASVPPTKAVTVGVYNEGNMGNWTNVLSSWGYSFGANLILGYQASTNSSGTIGGPTISGVGLSGSYTYGGCTTIP